MANISLSKENIRYIRDAFSHFFPEDAVYSADKPYVSGEFNWDNRKEFIGFVYRLTGVQIKSERDFENIKKAQLAVEKLVEAEKNPEANRPTKEQLETLEKEAKKTVEAQQKAAQEAKRNVEEAVKRKEELAKEAPRKEVFEDAVKQQQEIIAEEVQKTDEIRATLANQKIYFKVEKIPVKETREIKNLKQQAKANPKKFIEDTIRQFKSNPNIKGLTTEELQLASEQAAVTTYDVLTDNSPVVQVAIAKKIIASPEILNKYIPNIEKQTQFKNVIGLFIEQKTAQFELAKQFLNIPKIDGITSPESVTVQISETPRDGFGEFDLNQQIFSPHLENLNQQNLLLENLKSFGEGEIKSQFLSSIGTRLESYIAKLPTDSLLAKTYSSEIVQSCLSSLGIVETAPWVAAEGSLFGKMAIGSGFGPVLGWLGEKTGIDFGVKKAAEKIGTEVVEKMVVPTGTKVAVGATTGTGLAAAITAAFAWTGPLAPVIGTVGAFLIEIVGAKIINKVVDTAKRLLPKIKKNLIAISGGMLAAGLLVFPNTIFGTVLSVGGGLGLVGGIMNGGLSTLGTSLSSIGGGIAGFFGALGGAFLASVGMPIMITLLVFPVIVAFILFIVSSGAYIVPPTLLQLSAPVSNPFVSIEKTVNPTCMDRSGCSGFGTANYHIKITAKKGVLTNVQITNKYSLICKTSGQPIPSPDIPYLKNPPTQISPSKPVEFDYSFNVSSVYNDCLIIDTITITGDAEGRGDANTSASASISVGDPPEDCPQGWPVEGTWGITQGPRGNFSHTFCEAIDLATITGTGVTARHSGIATVVYTSGAYRPVYVDIASNCNGQVFTSRYAHLSAVSIANGQTVTMGQSIGATGSDGTGPHLHYEFFGLKMEIPYIPKSVPYGCGSVSTCGTIP